MNLEWPGASRVQQRAFRRLFVRQSRPVPQGAEIVTAYTDGQVTLRSNRGKERYHEAEDLSTYQGVEPGDFVVHGLDIMRGSIGVSDSRGAMSPVCVVCRPTKLAEPRYMAYAMRLQAASDYPKALARGVRDGGADFRRWNTLADLPLPSPPVEDQRLIADFLDRETAKIDALIEKQSELVRLLRERKALSVSPRAGDRVGEGERSKRYFREVDSRAGAELAGLPLLSVSIDWGVLPRDESTSSQAASEDLARYKVVERGDIVVNRMRAFQGALGVAPSRGLASPDYAVLRVASYVSPQWLASLMRSAPFVSEMVARLRGIGTIDGSNVRTPRVAVADIGEIRIVVPPLWLQHEEMAESASSAAKIDALIAKAEKFIALAKERRAALITAAVTGQIDVIREAS